MKIRYRNYLLEITDNRRWDFHKIVKRRKTEEDGTKGEEYEQEVLLGYDMQLETIAQEICLLEVRDNNPVELTFEEFFNEYKKEKDELKNMINEKLKVN
jgi:hypothetical protein